MSTQHPGQPLPPPGYGGPPRPGVFQPPPVVPTLHRTAYCPWGRRVLGSVIDFAPSILGAILYFVGYLITTIRLSTGAFDGGDVPTPTDFFSPLTIVGLVLILAALPWNLYNRWIVGGKTGQSLGKRVTGSRLLSEQTGAPVGAGMAFLRDLVHALDGAAYYVGYLWPLWDEKRQTFADKLMQTVVLPVAPVAPPAQPLPPTAPPSWSA